MRIERLLQLHMAALTSLATLLLGMGERDLTLPLLAVIVAVSSVFFSDIKGWIRLNNTAANVAGLAALAVSLWEWNRFRGEGQLLSMTNLLVYLQFILLYRRKTHRSYWQLALLSLLQVVVAGALNVSMLFGALLLVYTLLGLMTLTLFYLHRENALADGSEARASLPPPVEAPATRAPQDRRWPLALVQPKFSGGGPVAAAEAGLTFGLAWQVTRLGWTALVLSAFLFLALPRPGADRVWRPRGGPNAPRATGFSKTVSLGELGEVLENTDTFLTVRLFDEYSHEPYRVAGEPRFRGALLYEYKSGEWHRRDKADRAERMPIAAEIPRDQPLVRQIIGAGPLDDNVLFCIWPPIKDLSNVDLMHAPQSEQIMCREELLRSDEPVMFYYSLLTTGLRDHLQLDAARALGRPDEAELLELLQLPRLEDGRDPLAGLKAEAERVVADLPANREVRARALEIYLRNSPRFQYSLQPVERDSRLDPVEDFVTLHPQGHCEYFASALTLMLRSLGIPARMAIGFKGGDWNNFGQLYDVKHLHAHTWVEVYFGSDSPPTGILQPEKRHPAGYWLTLDPTPGDGAPRAPADFGSFAFKQIADFSQFIWSNYVLGMDYRRQQEGVFQPLVRNMDEFVERLADTEFRQAMLAEVRALLTPSGWGLSRSDWFSWRGLLISMTMLLLGSLGYRAFERLLHLIKRLVPRRLMAGKGPAAARAAFYRRFEALLARHGLVRPACQTQREFAVAAGGQLAESPLTRPAALLPRSIAEAYYRVRFGAAQLQDQETSVVEKAISDLAGVLEASARRPS